MFTTVVTYNYVTLEVYDKTCDLQNMRITYEAKQPSVCLKHKLLSFRMMTCAIINEALDLNLYCRIS